MAEKVKKLKNKRVKEIVLNTVNEMSVHIDPRKTSRAMSDAELKAPEVLKAIKNKWVVVVEEDAPAPKKEKTAKPAPIPELPTTSGGKADKDVEASREKKFSQK